MKSEYLKYLLVVGGVGVVSLFTACKDDVAPAPPGFEYQVHILSPDGNSKQIGDTLRIDVEFKSLTGMTVHHINVRIYNKAGGTDIYSKPDEAHVHQESGMYEFKDDFVLSTAHGVTGDSDYVLEAKVWSDEDGVGEVSESIDFHVDL